MKVISETGNKYHWPRQKVKSIETRKRDLIIRIADWTRDREEPGFDVECYIGGVYDWQESKSCTVNSLGTKEAAKREAIHFARKQVARLL